MGIYEYLKKQLWTNCQIEIDLSDILRKIVATGKPIEYEGNGSRSLDHMTSRISSNVVDPGSFALFFPKLNEVINQVNELNSFAEADAFLKTQIKSPNVLKQL